MTLDDGLQPHLAAAEKLTQPDAQTYRFTLRSLKFHDGSPLTAAAVKAYYDSLLDPAVGSPFRGALAGIDRITVPTPQVIEFHLAAPNPFGLNLFTRPLIKVDSGLAGASLGDRPNGLGPYQVAADSKATAVVLKRTATAPIGAPQELDFPVVPDPVVRLLKVQQGEADILQNDLPPALYRYGKGQGLTALTAPAASYTYLGFNLTDKVTGNLAVRQAIAHAIDRNLLMRTLLVGAASPARSLLPKGAPAYWPAPDLAYDPARAKRLLDDAGFKPGADGMRLHIRFSTTSNPGTLLVVQAIQQQLREVGIDARLNISEWGTFYGNIKKGNFQLYLMTWVGLFQPDIFQTVFASSMMPPVGANRGRYQNPVMDKLIAAMMVEMDAPKRHQLARQIQQLQQHDLIYVPLWSRDHMVLLRPGLEGYTVPLDGGYEGLLKVHAAAPAQ